MFLGFTFSIGAHSISEEFVDFSPLWSPRVKLFLSLGFTFAIGAHSISEEVAGFSPLWFPLGKLFVSLVSSDYCCACYSLR